MKIRILQPHNQGANQPTIHRGTIVEARLLNGLLGIKFYQVTEDGTFCGMNIPFEKCIALPEECTYSEAEYVAVHQELLRRREEVKELEYKVEAHVAGRKRAESAADRLERELQEAREAKKVPLPREVVKAIDRLAVGISPFGIAKFVAKRCGPEAAIICDWINSAAPLEVPVRYQLLMEALVNGYTVEEPGESLKDELADIVHEWRKSPQKYGAAEDDRILAGRILDHIRQKEQISG